LHNVLRLQGPFRVMKATLIIPSYRRENPLIQTLEGAVSQDFPGLEIILVDQTPEHAHATNKFLDEHKTRICVIRQEEANLPVARNAGIRASHGEIVIFADDDVILPQGFVSAHAKNYKDASVMAVAGPVLSPAKRWRRELPPSVTHPLYRHFAGCWQYDRKMSVCHAPGGNHSIRREVWDKVGPYDERFVGPGLREESDFFLRVHRAGMSIVYDPDAWLIHDPPQDGSGCWQADGGAVSFDRLYCHALFCRKNFTGAEQVKLFLHHLRGSLSQAGLRRMSPSAIPVVPRLVRAWRKAGCALQLMAREKQ